MSKDQEIEARFQALEGQLSAISTAFTCLVANSPRDILANCAKTFEENWRINQSLDEEDESPEYFIETRDRIASSILDLFHAASTRKQ